MAVRATLSPSRPLQRTCATLMWVGSNTSPPTPVSSNILSPSSALKRRSCSGYPNSSRTTSTGTATVSSRSSPSTNRDANSGRLAWTMRFMRPRGSSSRLRWKPGPRRRPFQLETHLTQCPSAATVTGRQPENVFIGFWWTPGALGGPQHGTSWTLSSFVFQ